MLTATTTIPCVTVPDAVAIEQKVDELATQCGGRYDFGEGRIICRLGVVQRLEFDVTFDDQSALSNFTTQLKLYQPYATFDVKATPSLLEMIDEALADRDLGLTP
jgi:hypothetical protein